jgi:hypothetical protein
LQNSVPLSLQKQMPYVLPFMTVQPSRLEALYSLMLFEEV